MSDYLIRLAAKSLNLSNVILPRQASLYEPLSMDIRDTFDSEWLGFQSLNESMARDSAIFNTKSRKPLKKGENSALINLEENLQENSPDGPGQSSLRVLSVRQSLASDPIGDNIIEKDGNRICIERSGDPSSLEGRPDTSASKPFRDNPSEEMPFVADKKIPHNLEMAQSKPKLEKNKYTDYREKTTEPNLIELISEPSIAIQPSLRKEAIEKTQIDLNDQGPSKEKEIPLDEQQSMKPSTSNLSGENPSYEHPLYEGRIAERRLFETEEESNFVIPASSPILTSPRDDKSIKGNTDVSGSMQVPSRLSLVDKPLLDSSMSDNITKDRENNEIHAFPHTLQPDRMNYHKESIDVSALKTFEDESLEEMPSTLKKDIPYSSKVVQSKSELEKTEYALVRNQMNEPHIAQPSLKPSIVIQPSLGNISPKKISMLPKDEKILNSNEVYSREQEHHYTKSSIPSLSIENPSDENPSNEGRIAEKSSSGTEKESNNIRIQKPAVIEEDWQNVQYPLRRRLIQPYYYDISPSKRSLIKEGISTNLPISSADIEGSREQKLKPMNHRPEVRTGSKEVKSPEQSVIKEDEKIYPQSKQLQISDENLQQQAFATSPFTKPPSEEAQFIKRYISERGKTAELENILASQPVEDLIRENQWVSDMLADMHKVQPMNHRISEIKKDDTVAMPSESEGAKNQKAKFTNLLPLGSITPQIHEAGKSAVKDEREDYAKAIPEQTNIRLGEQPTSVSSSQISLTQDGVITERSLIRTVDALKGTKLPFTLCSNEAVSQNTHEVSSKASPQMDLHIPFAFQSSIKRASFKLSPAKISRPNEAGRREQSGIESSTNKMPSSTKVTIGRVDIHAPPVERIYSREPSSTSAKKLSLDDYLKMRNEGRL